MLHAARRDHRAAAPSLAFRPFDLLIVRGGSMEPAIPVGAPCSWTTPPGHRTVGAVLTFHDAVSGVVTHRVVAVLDGSFVTKGDSNASADVTRRLAVRSDRDGPFSVPLPGLRAVRPAATDRVLRRARRHAHGPCPRPGARHSATKSVRIRSRRGAPIPADRTEPLARCVGPVDPPSSRSPCWPSRACAPTAVVTTAYFSDAAPSCSGSSPTSPNRPLRHPRPPECADMDLRPGHRRHARRRSPRRGQRRRARLRARRQRHARRRQRQGLPRRRGGRRHPGRRQREGRAARRRGRRHAPRRRRRRRDRGRQRQGPSRRRSRDRRLLRHDEGPLRALRDRVEGRLGGPGGTPVATPDPTPTPDPQRARRRDPITVTPPPSIGASRRRHPRRPPRPTPTPDATPSPELDPGADAHADPCSRPRSRPLPTPEPTPAPTPDSDAAPTPSLIRPRNPEPTPTPEATPAP